MDLKNQISNAIGAVKDTFSEAGHKSTADAEHAKRDVAGDTMTTEEKVGSMANEAKNDIQAGMDHAKVEARKEV